MKQTIVMVTLLALTIAPSIGEETQQDPKKYFSQPFQINLGQVVAMSLWNTLYAQMHKTRADYRLKKWDAPVIVGYNKEIGKVEIAIYGDRSSIDDAKKSVDRFRSDILQKGLEVVNALYNASVTENHISIGYYHEGRKLLTFTHGAYVID